MLEKYRLESQRHENTAACAMFVGIYLVFVTIMCFLSVGMTIVVIHLFTNSIAVNPIRMSDTVSNTDTVSSLLNSCLSVCLSVRLSVCLSFCSVSLSLTSSSSVHHVLCSVNFVFVSFFASRLWATSLDERICFSRSPSLCFTNCDFFAFVD